MEGTREVRQKFRDAEVSKRNLNFRRALGRAARSRISPGYSTSRACMDWSIIMFG